MGRYDFPSEGSRSGFFSNGVMYAALNCVGNTPDDSDLLNSSVMNGANTSALSLRRCVGSGSVAHCLAGSLRMASMTSSTLRAQNDDNALDASVRCDCEQKRLQRLSKTVSANNRIPQTVRHGIPDRRTSHTDSPSTIGAEPVARYNQELSGGGSEMLPRCDTCDWLAQFREVRRHFTVQAVEHHDAKLVHHSLRNIQPMWLCMDKSRQASVELVRTADHTCVCVCQQTKK